MRYRVFRAVKRSLGWVSAVDSQGRTIWIAVVTRRSFFDLGSRLKFAPYTPAKGGHGQSRESSP